MGAVGAKGDKGERVSAFANVCVPYISVLSKN